MLTPAMTEWEAVQQRVSCRAFQDKPVPDELLEALTDCISALNAESHLSFQLITTDGENVPHLKLSAAMFSGPVRVYAALVGGSGDLDAEKVGYYGEKLVLYATQLGLGTCWVGGTYDPKSASARVGENEKLWDVVPIGFAAEKTPIKQKMLRATIRSRDRKIEQFVEGDTPFAQLPEWVRRGVEAVRMGPSAVNQQPVNFLWQDGAVCARLWKPAKGLTLNDLGIAKVHFMVGAAAAGKPGHWGFGDNERFCPEGE